MRKIKIVFILLIFISIFTSPQSAFAGTASNIADDTISVISRSAYVITKYTLKGSWFIIRKTAKGAYSVAKSILKGGDDAFSKKPSAKKTYSKPSTPVKQLPKNDFTPVKYQTLPPPPVIL